MREQYTQLHRSRFLGGFTLIEVMVAVSIFALVVTIGLSALLNINVSHTHSRAQQAVMDQINFALETMSREIRVGYDYRCGTGGGNPDCAFPNGASRFEFTTFEGNPGVFELSDGKIFAELKPDHGRAQLTPDSLTVNELRFIVQGASDNDSVQPLVIMTVDGTTRIRSEEANYVFQTAISQRRPDLSSL